MSTGIVRRIDELGRIVIPKEFRRTMRLKEGDEMEILSSGDEITLKKYSGFESAMAIVKTASQLLAKATDADVLFMSPQCVEVAEGLNKKYYASAKLSDEFSGVVRSRRSGEIAKEELADCFCDVEPLSDVCLMEPVVSGGDLVGAAAIFGNADEYAASYLKFCVRLIEAALG